MLELVPYFPSWIVLCEIDTRLERHEHNLAHSNHFQIGERPHLGRQRTFVRQQETLQFI